MEEVKNRTYRSLAFIEKTGTKIIYIVDPSPYVNQGNCNKRKTFHPGEISKIRKRKHIRMPQTQA